MSSLRMASNSFLYILHIATGARLVGAEDLELPSLSAVVTDFLQQHMDPAHDPVEGMLGMVRGACHQCAE